MCANLLSNQAIVYFLNILNDLNTYIPNIRALKQIVGVL